MALLGALLVFGLAVHLPIRVERSMLLVDILPLPQPVVAPPPRPRTHAAKDAPSPPNLRNKATNVVVPRTIVPPQPIISPITAAPVAGAGSAASAGASDMTGPGTGAGGMGAGNGGGGDGDDGSPPRQIRGHLKFSDLPPYLREAGRSASVGVRYRVDIDGRVSNCTVSHSSGEPDLDALTCQLIEQRFRFKPSLDADGQPVRSIVVETHSWVIDRSDE